MRFERQMRCSYFLSMNRFRRARRTATRAFKIYLRWGCRKWAKPFLGRVRFFTFRPRTGRTASTPSHAPTRATTALWRESTMHTRHVRAGARRLPHLQAVQQPRDRVSRAVPNTAEERRRGSGRPHAGRLLRRRLPFSRRRVPHSFASPFRRRETAAPPLPRRRSRQNGGA